MKIERWLHEPMSARVGLAVIRVEPDEVADVEKMAILIDGDSVGHFGIEAELVATGKAPEIEYSKRLGWEPKKQFGYDRFSAIKKEPRFYRVFVHRD